VANAGPDQNITIDELVILDGSVSYDPDGDNLNYKWDFGDETSTEWLNNSTSSHSYDKIGIYIVTLTVRDVTPLPLLIDKDVCIVRVFDIKENQPPIADAGPDQNITVNQTLNLDGSGSFDPDGVIILYEWTSSIEGKLEIGKILRNIKLSAGIHTITLTVSDGELTDTDTCIIRVFDITRNLPPLAKIKPIKDAIEGEKVYFSAADSFDEDGHIIQYIWDFGDDSEVLRTNKTEVEHTWQSAGNYTIILTVIDNQSAKGSDSIEIIVTQSETIDSDGKDRASQYNTYAIILIVIVIIILLILATLKLFLSRSKRQREKRLDPDEEILSKMKHKFLDDEPLSEMEYSRNDISEMVERKFKTGQLSEHTYHLIKSEVLFSEEAQLDQTINSKLEGKE